MELKPVLKKLEHLCRVVYEEDGAVPVLDREEHPNEWSAWRSWRQRNRLSVSFMDTRKTWTVPTWLPPVSIDDEIKIRRKAAKELLR